jgi:Tfp pilus assembly protein PilV
MRTFAAMIRSLHRVRTRAERISLAADESGVTLIEVMISAVLVATIAIATLTGFDAAGRATADERAHNQATLLAGQDEERLRSLGAQKLGQLGTQTRTVSENGTAFTISSSAQFVSASKESLTCESSGGNADYIQTTSSVTWSALGSREAVKQSSIVAIPSTASLLVKVVNQNNEAVSGATVAVTGTSTNASQTTPAAGCVVFGALADKTVKVTATKSGWVNVNGETAPAAKEVTLSSTSLTSVEFRIAEPGTIVVKFVSNGVSTGITSDTFFALQTGASGAFIGGTPEKYGSSASLSGLFPFVTVGKPPTENPYKIWAGDCEANSPEKVASIEPEKAQVEPGGTVEKKVEVPPLSITVYKGTATGEGVLTTATSAKLTNSVCSSSTALNESPLVYARNVTINNTTGLMEPKYQPYSNEFQLCVVGLVSGKYYKNTEKFSNKVKAGTTGTMFLKKGNPTGTTTEQKC